MKKIIFRALALLSLTICFSLANGQVSSYKKIPLDSLPNITINKLIYYQTPIYFYKGVLTNKTYLPNWYEAECAISNISVHKPSVKAKYYAAKLGVKEEELSRMDKDTFIINTRKRKFEKWPSKIFYGEVWLTINKTGQQVVLVLNTIKEKEFSNLEFRKPDKKNYEAINDNGSYFEPTVFIYEDRILKVADQFEIISQFTNSRKEVISLDLETYQDLLFRSKTYVRSTLTNGKRIFETIENTPNGIIVRNVSNKPE